MPVETITPEVSIPTSPQEGGDDRATMLAEIARLDDSGNLPESDDNLDLTEDAPDNLASQESAEEAEAEAEAEPGEAESEEAAEPPVLEAAPDAALEKIQQAEKRSKERLADHMASERAKFKEEQESHAARLAEAEKVMADHDARTRRSFDPSGKSKEELMAEARKIHALAIAADPDADPAQRAQAARTVKEQQIEDRLSAAEKRADEAEARFNAREQEAQMSVQKAKMVDHLTSSVRGDTPLLRNMLAGKGAEAAKERCLAVAVALYEQTGETPDVEDVQMYVEEAEREKLEHLGLDLDVVLKATSPTKIKNPAAEEKKSASPTLGNDLTTSTQPRDKPLTESEERADILKGMASL